ncbi:MAG: hypothetical protein QOI55_478, partial [Actinomycetota bacterium]|nr:hypothetical protein [Actinomycetota bacterium]
AGMGPDEMAEIASMIGRVLRAADDETVAKEVKDQAARLCSKFTPYPDM